MRTAELCYIDEDPLMIEVTTLKQLICNQQSIQEDNLILIANGGLCVQDGVLSNYNCGDHETNPVFVYLRLQKRALTINTQEIPVKKDFTQNIERLNIVLKKSGNNVAWLRENEAMGLILFESSRKIKQLIDSLIQDQFLLVEGWNAAVANLCDSLQSIEKRIVAMKENLSRFQKCEFEEGFNMLEKFEKRKIELEKVPLLRSLLKSGNTEEEEELPVNLLQWVLYKDKATTRHVTVQSIVTDAHEAYCTLMGITTEVSLIFEDVRRQWGNCGMLLEVLKGIQDGEELVEKCKPVQLQSQDDGDEERSIESSRDHYTSNKAYMERLNYLGGVRERCEQLIKLIQTYREYAEHTVRQCKDSISSTVLQDHCVNCKVQLGNLGKYYSQMAEWLHKVTCSKADLVKNIDDRKNWLMKYETSICKVDENLFLAKEKLKRVRAGCRVLEQMSTAPKIYAQGISEIKRRQTFLDTWYSWGTHCSQLSKDLRRKDHEMRMSLDHDLENHFIQSLFNCLHSFILPKLGTRLLNSTPPTLPQISDEDISTLVTHAPDLLQFLQDPQIDLLLLKSMPIFKSSLTDIVNQSQMETRSIFTKPRNDSCVSLEDVSLMPVPEDTPIQLEELCLSEQGILRSRNLVESSSGEESSKMVRSIDSMDFQLTNDKTTETGKDLICVPRTFLETLLLSTKELRTKIDSVKSDYLRQGEEQTSLIMRTSTFLQEVLAEFPDNEEEKKTEGSVCYEKQLQDTPLLCLAESSKTVLLTHKEFVTGDVVCFTGQIINDNLQWRMLTSDSRINFLHDECLGSSRLRRESAFVVSADIHHQQSPMTKSQQSPKICRSSLSPSSLIWGTFISREEYISKKTRNRYGLPVDTKFFRVRANINWST